MTDVHGCCGRYIPQEVLKDNFSALDRADVFMLGASLYELALGTHLPSGLARAGMPHSPMPLAICQVPLHSRGHVSPLLVHDLNEVSLNP